MVPPTSLAKKFSWTKNTLAFCGKVKGGEKCVVTMTPRVCAIKLFWSGNKY
jgi:hypothetical protein